MLHSLRASKQQGQTHPMGLEGKKPDNLNIIQIGLKVHFFLDKVPYSYPSTSTAIRQATDNRLYSGIRDEPVDKRSLGQGPKVFFPPVE